MSIKRQEDNDEDYAVYDETSCRGHGKRTGLGFLSRSIKKGGSSLQSSRILSKSKLLGKSQENDKKALENKDSSSVKPSNNYWEEDSKTGVMGKKKEIIKEVYGKKNRNLKKI